MIKQKIIINIVDDTPPDKAVFCVFNVITKGKVSKVKNKEQYCFVSTFRDGKDKIVVCAKEKYNTNSDIFYVYKERTKNE